ncbi:MAG: hypothetical protein WCE21_02205 [Candidatus Babeliales bacterium]
MKLIWRTVVNMSILGMICPGALHALVGINLFRAYDINLLMPRWQGTNVQWVDWAEFSYKVQGVNEDGHRVPVTQLWSDKQDAIAMLRGFDAQSPMTQFLQNNLENIHATDTRGMFTVNGNLEARSYDTFIRGFLPHNMVFGVYVPIYDMRLNHVSFKDLTTENTAEDIIVKEQLTSVLKSRIHEFDPTLNLNGWHRVGFGDVIVMGEWCRDFPQAKEALKNVFLTGRLGFNLPTGVKTDSNEFFSVPFGFDGSMGMIFGAGLILNWYNHIRGGLDFEFTYLFGNTRERRVKVDLAQTDLLLLAKVKTHTDFGFIQRYNLFIAVDPWDALSLKAIYQFFKHSDDTVTLRTNAYSDFIANNARNLQEWTFHHMIFKATLDLQYLLDAPSVKPQVALFAKFPFNGQRAILCSTVGFEFNLNF